MEKEEDKGKSKEKEKVSLYVSSQSCGVRDCSKITLTESEKVPTDFKKQGKRNRVNGGIFERKVRADLEKKGWIVNKWMNNVDLIKNKLIPSKRKYNPFMKALSVGTGFPDFMCMRPKEDLFDVILVEVKRNGIFDKEEKEKAKWYLQNKIVKEILIAMEERNGRKLEVKYINFLEKYPKCLI